MGIHLYEAFPLIIFKLLIKLSVFFFIKMNYPVIKVQKD